MKNRGFFGVDFWAGEKPKIVERFQNVRLMRRMSGRNHVDHTVIATNTFFVCHRLHPERWAGNGTLDTAVIPIVPAADGMAPIACQRLTIAPERLFSDFARGSLPVAHILRQILYTFIGNSVYNGLAYPTKLFYCTRKISACGR